MVLSKDKMGLSTENILFLFFITTIVIIFSTIAPTKTINNRDEQMVECGWPLPFMIVDESRWDPPYPWQYHCGFYNLEAPTQFLWPRFVYNFVVIFLSLNLILLLIKKSSKSF